MTEPGHATAVSHFRYEVDPNTTEILDVCAFLNSMRHKPIDSMAKASSGFLADDQPGQKQKHFLYPIEHVLQARVSSESLRKVLKGSQAQDSRLLRRDRLHIAATLACSVLKLHGTPWLKEQWTSDNILLHNADANQIGRNYKHIYLEWEYKTSGAPPHASNMTDSSKTRKRETHSESLFALGLTLIELCFGKTLAEMQVPEDRDSQGTDRLVNTAMRLMNTTYDEMGGQYGDVVRRCLRQPFDLRDLSLGNEEMQHEVVDGIVTPLIQSLRNF